ncbi:MAG: secretin N-terminal domain-containing protein, partial [Vicinamibacterales bacterium]
MTRNVTLVGLVALAGALISAPKTGVEAAAGSALLKTITSRVLADRASLTIEASEPVAYVTTRPDPLTVLLDFRNVDATGLATTLAEADDNPIARVMVEPLPGDVAVTRVRIALAEPVAHRVHSERSSVIVDFERGVAKGQPIVLPPASRGAADPLQALARLDTSQTTPAAAAPASVTREVRLAQSAQTPISGGTRTYVGDPISLDFQGADLRAVLRTFSEISTLNMVIDPSVTGTVDVALRDVPWDQALDQILRANKLGYFVDGTIVRIAPLTVLADEEAQRRKLAEEQALAGELRVVTHALSYAKADEMVDLLEASALSQRGTVQVDTRTNTLIVTDLPDRIDTVIRLLTTLDTPQPQVEIEARIVQTNKDYARALGIEWGFTGRADAALGNTTNLAFPNNGSLTGSTDLPVAPAASAVGL